MDADAHFILGIVISFCKPRNNVSGLKKATIECRAGPRGLCAVVFMTDKGSFAYDARRTVGYSSHH